MDGTHPNLGLDMKTTKGSLPSISEETHRRRTALELEGDGQVGLTGEADAHVRTGVNGSALAASMITR